MNNKLFNKKLNVMLWGNSPNASILAEKISESNFLNHLYIVSTNEILSKYGQLIEKDGYSLVLYAKENNIDLFIADTEYNYNGLTSAFLKAGIKTIGIPKQWTQLEASKFFAKNFMKKHKINYTHCEIAHNIDEFKSKIIKKSYPFYIKADGYSSGLGVFCVSNENNAIKYANMIFNKTFETNSTKILIEEIVEGKEVSLISLWDGKTLISLPPISDYKRINNNKYALNTGSMGCFFPSILTKEEKSQINIYHKALKKALQKEQAKFYGPIYTGLKLTNNNYCVLEYNMRFGSPEGTAIFSNLKNDILDFFIHWTSQNLENYNLEFSESKTQIVLLYRRGYPFIDNGEYILEKKFLDTFHKNNIKTYCCNCSVKNNNISMTKKSFIILVCSNKKCSKKIYSILEEMNLSEVIYRKDIKFEH